MAKRPRPDMDQVRDALRERDQSAEDEEARPPDPPAEDEDDDESDA
jgi:hypothetical protein